MSIKVKKIFSGRKRFIKTLPLAHPEDWATDLLFLKNFLNRETNLQLVGSKTYLESSPEGLSLMLEVIGVPSIPDQKGLKLADLEEGDVLVHAIPDLDLFSLDFEGLLLTSSSIYKALSLGESKLSAVFHIVFDYEKIELHFFRQKDYIQNLL